MIVILLIGIIRKMIVVQTIRKVVGWCGIHIKSFNRSSFIHNFCVPIEKLIVENFFGTWSFLVLECQTVFYQGL